MSAVLPALPVDIMVRQADCMPKESMLSRKVEYKQHKKLEQRVVVLDTRWVGPISVTYESVWLPVDG